MAEINDYVDELVAFWEQLDFSSPPYFHPEDEISPKRIAQNIRSYNDYVQAFRSISLSDKKYHLNLLPNPYTGNMRTASILILFANPGLHPADYIAEEMFEEYNQEIKHNILQTQPKHYCLNPKWAWTPAFSWWEAKFKNLAMYITKNSEEFKDNYSGALSAIARQTASLELVPYHSKTFSGKSDLKSSDVARKFAA